MMSFLYTDEVILCVRWLIVGLALYNIRWSAPGIFDIFRGHFWPVSIYRSVVALMSIFTMGFQTTALLRDELALASPWVLMWLMLVVAAHGLAAYGRCAGHYRLGQRFYWLITSGHLKVALAMADYHAVNPQKATELADDLRQRTSKRLAARVLKDG